MPDPSRPSSAAPPPASRLRARIATLGMFVLAALTLLVLLQRGWLSQADRQRWGEVRRVARPAELPFAIEPPLHGVEFDRQSGIMQASGAPRAWLFKPPLEDRERLRSLRLRYEPLVPFSEKQFRLSPYPPGMPHEGEPWDWGRTVAGVVHPSGDGQMTVSWNLPWPARAVGVGLPEGARFRLIEAEWLETDVGRGVDARVEAFRLALPGLVLALLIAGGQWLLGCTISPATARHLGLLGVLASGLLVVFFLPPFQGPDEYRHWKAGLALFGRGDERELMLLHETLDIERLKHRSEEHFDASRLLGTAGEVQPTRDSIEVPYRTLLTYPFLALLAGLFPPVDSTSEAMLFYYLARLLPLAALLVLLYGISRRNCLSWVAIALFSMPLMLQQIVTISPDTCLNLGTLAAAWLFIEWRRAPSVGKSVTLFLISLGVVLAKPPMLAPLLLLPLVCLRWSWIPWKKITLPVTAGVIVLTAGMVFLWGYRKLERGDPNQTARQLRFVSTPEGRETFLKAYGKSIGNKLRLSSWSGGFDGLGWVDTYFRARHEELIAGFCCLALLLDLLIFGGSLLVGIFWRHPWRALLILLVLAIFAVTLTTFAALMMYLMASDPTPTGITGFQARYLFPVGILVALLPLALVPQELDREPPPKTVRTAILRIAAGLALGLALWCLALRQAELFTDLALRYW